MWSVILIQWLHVLMGITWFGAVIFYNFVALPALMSCPAKDQGTVMGRLAKYTPRLVVPASILVILLGFLRGTVFGPIKSVSFLFGTAYGITWMIALALALINFVEGIGIGMLAESVNTIEVDAHALEEGKVPTALVTKMQQIRMRTLISLLVFLPIFTCMILMRFGL